MSGLPWFRMYCDFLNDPKIIGIAFEDQRHFIGILALKCDGIIDQECDEKIMDRITAQRLWLDYATIVEVKTRLVKAKLINKNWQPLAWEKRQRKSDFDHTGAERQRRFRDKNKPNALRNATVTPPDKIREEKKRVERFNPPSKDDLNLYAKDKSLNVEGFIDHYTSNGWMVGKNKMKCWKAAASGWSRRQGNFKNTQTPTSSSRRAI